MLPAEPGSTPSAAGSMMSNVLDDLMCSACSCLWHSLFIPMPTAASGLCHGSCCLSACIFGGEPTSTPNPTALSLADVADNDDADRPHYQEKTPACHDGCEKRGAAIAPSALYGMPPAATLPLVAFIEAPLSVNPDVADNVNAAPRHEHRRAARERAGIHLRRRGAPGYDGPENALPQ